VTFYAIILQIYNHFGIPPACSCWRLALCSDGSLENASLAAAGLHPLFYACGPGQPGSLFS
jgi:hypothetical protein